MYMVKTSVYLPDGLKERLAQASAVSGESEAQIIRSALERWLEGLLSRPRPRLLGQLDLGDPDLPEKVDDLLAEGFGER
jgi:hypothetical protein